MKLNRYQKSNIILFTVLILCVLVAFSIGFYLFLSGNDEILVNADETENVTVSQVMTAFMTEPILPQTETTIPPESDTDKISFDDERQSHLNEFSREIAMWIEQTTPIYQKVAETDEEGNEKSQAESYKPPIAFYYMDIESGYTMEYNTEYVFYTASIIKVPYVLFALMEIEKAELAGDVKGTKFDVDKTFIYAEDKYKSGSGIIQNSEFGSVYTYYDLLKFTIMHSDNIAFSELRNIFGRQGFNAFSESIGVKNPQKKLYSANAREMGAYLLEIYKYFESGGKYADDLKNWMLGTNHRIMIPSAVKPFPVANKYGWDFGAYHDIAIVFNEHPYLLVIMTELENGTRDDNVFIRELVAKINEIHISLYGAKQCTP